MTSVLRKGLAAVLAVGGVAAVASAQPPAQPQVVRWPGGYMVTNGPDVLVRQSGSGSSTTLLSGVGNGVGNKVVVSNGRSGGTTVITNSRLGFGNSIVVDDEEWLWEGLFPARKPAVVAPPAVIAADPVAVACPPVYKGKANAFWAKKEWSEAHDCNVYWDAASKAWYRYHKDDDAYKQLPDANK